MDESTVKSFWGTQEVKWSAKNSKGKSWCMIIMWDPNLLESLFSFEGEGFLGVQFLWNGSIIYVINVYSSCHIQYKRKLRLSLSCLKHPFSVENDAL